MQDLKHYDAAAIDHHIDCITPAHRAAFGTPIVTDYQPGQTVWLMDHYNTAEVIGTADARLGELHWTVRTVDADGSVETYEYPARHLRHADKAVEYLFPAVAAQRN